MSKIAFFLQELEKIYLNACLSLSKSESLSKNFCIPQILMFFSENIHFFLQHKVLIYYSFDLLLIQCQLFLQFGFKLLAQGLRMEDFQFRAVCAELLDEIECRGYKPFKNTRLDFLLRMMKRQGTQKLCRNRNDSCPNNLRCILLATEHTIVA